MLFFILGALFLLIGALPLIHTIRRSKNMGTEQKRRAYIRSVIIFGIFIVLLILVNVFFGIFTEFLWFDSLDFQVRYVTEILARVGLYVGGLLVAFVIVVSAVQPAYRIANPNGHSLIPLGFSIVLAAFLGLMTSQFWEQFLLFANQAAAQAPSDPVFGISISFYLFSLPFLASLFSWLLFVLVLSGIAVATLAFFNLTFSAVEQGSARRDSSERVRVLYRLRKPFLTVVSGVFLILALQTLLSISRLVFSETGVVTGAGWMDLNVRVPALLVTTALLLGLSILLLLAAHSRGLLSKVFGIHALTGSNESGQGPEEGSSPGKPELQGVRLSKRSALVPLSVVALLVIINGVLPPLFQNAVVSPNEITLERPYIDHNITYTQRAFNLSPDDVTEQQLPIGRNVTQAVADANPTTLDNIRLWDWRALLDNLRQQQEIRLYYAFDDVDIDRYVIDGEYRQVMLSVRELDKNQLATQSQTWVSRHLRYTHGYGMVLLPAHEFEQQGRPRLLIENIPPQHEFPRLEVNRPEIYYGERTNDHVYVRTTQQEFDYPAADENVFTTYEGNGGVEMGGLVRRFAFAWKYDGYRQLFSSYFRPDSRIMFYRNIRQRVSRLAPFLRYDRDPYPVLTEDGRIVYIIDAYTVADTYPYSEPYAGDQSEFRGVNYIRNSVKVVVDAYHGDVSFYAIDPDDIVLETYSRVFPGLFQPFEEMPEDLVDHIRYPQGLLTVQAEVYSTYHMDDVDAFYQREDVWQFATERYRNNFQRVAPYYVMVQFPDSDRAEFVLMIPFTPKNKNVMNAWMAGRSDHPNYGELIVYPFPKGVEVLGPRQIEARIDQNSEMSQTLSLWDQQGSQVVRGNLLAIPLFHNEELYIMFAEPIFLEATDAQLPEVRRIALADQRRVVWSDSFEAALDALLAEPDEEPTVVTTGPAAAAGDGQAAAAPGAGLPQSVVSQALELFNEYQNQLGQGNFEQAGARLEELYDLLNRYSEG
jgi:hypothetical protein